VEECSPATPASDAYPDSPDSPTPMLKKKKTLVMAKVNQAPDNMVNVYSVSEDCTLACWVL